MRTARRCIRSAGARAWLAAGDFSQDGYDDLAIGAPYEDVFYATGIVTDSGALMVVYDTSGYAMNVAGGEFIHQGLSWINGPPEEDDHFGVTLAAIPAGFKVFLPVMLRGV